MAWMIVHKGGTFRRPQSKYSFTFVPSPQPQQWPRDVVEYAVSTGRAKRTVSPRRNINRT